MSMGSTPSALAFLLMIFAGWVNRRQLIAIEYLQAENRMLREAEGPTAPLHGRGASAAGTKGQGAGT